MGIDRRAVFDAVRAEVPGIWNVPGTVDLMDRLLDMVAPGAATEITPRVAAELIAHEGVALEAYKDSVGVWTWSAGLTAAAGIDPLRYKDSPALLEQALISFLSVMRDKYLPAVLRAFEGVEMSEAQLAAALSFHWNTGAIERAEWVKLYRAGAKDAARKAIMNWTKPAVLAERRARERDLFFDGRWTGTGAARVYTIAKPSYRPGFSRKVNVMPILEAML